MKLTIESKLLSELCSKAKPVAGSKSSLPILGCFLLTADQSSMTVSACNLDILVKLSADCAVNTTGSVAINASRLLQSLSAFGPGELNLSADQKHVLTISRGANSVVLNGESADGWTTLPFRDSKGSLDIPQGRLKAIFRKVLPCVSYDEERWVINGAAISQHDGRCAFVATDGRRMRAEWIDHAHFVDAIIPTEAATLVGSLCDESDGLVTLSLSDNGFSASCGNWHVSGKLIEGNFPQWKQLTQGADAKKCISFNRDEMVSALRISGVAAHTMTNGKPSVKLDGGRSELTLSGRSDNGSSKAAVPGGVNTIGSIAFDASFLRDLINSFDESELTLAGQDAMSPVMATGPTGIAVLMPLRIL